MTANFNRGQTQPVRASRTFRLDYPERELRKARFEIVEPHCRKIEIEQRRPIRP